MTPVYSLRVRLEKL